jgi:glutathione S-transferase
MDRYWNHPGQPMYELYIANKNYSSWSMRPWVLMRGLDIAFKERLMPFHLNLDKGEGDFRRFSPTGRVPCLVDGDVTVWDSLAIAEYLAESHPVVWPAHSVARAWARCAAAEMHSGFGTLRNECPMSVGVRIRLKKQSTALDADIDRLNALWADGLSRFGGPFLAGARFTAVDAFFAPVATRIQTYGLAMSAPAKRYADQSLQTPAVTEWIAGALTETWRDVAHEAEILQCGEMLRDLRAH